MFFKTAPRQLSVSQKPTLSSAIALQSPVSQKAEFLAAIPRQSLVAQKPGLPDAIPWQSMSEQKAMFPVAMARQVAPDRVSALAKFPTSKRNV
jgi:hypothetical protein